MSPEALVERAKELGIQSLSLTDINNVSAMPEFVKLCKDNGIRPVAGVEFRKSNKLLYIIIAKNNAGFANINEFASNHNISRTSLSPRPPLLNDTYVIYPFRGTKPAELNHNEYIGIKPGELTRLATSELRRNPEKLVALYPVTFLSESDHEVHRHLRAINNNVLLTLLDEGNIANRQEVLMSETMVRKAFEDYEVLVDNAQKILDQSHVDFDFAKVKNKKSFTGSKSDDKQLLEKLATEGLEHRYGTNNPEARKRVLHELEVIHELGFSAYFLITWDIIRYSMAMGFYHVGRGSGANSIVAYCLRITDVDPIELDLYFERFINPKRTSPPDFDIDYSWKERDRVLDYIFKRYGHGHVAMLGTVTTFRDRSTIRELGKVVGLPKGEIDILVKNHEARHEPDEVGARILQMAEKIADFPNIRSIHAGGVLISEEPLYCYTVLDMPPKGLPTTQWNMYTAEDLSYEKIDILSQRGIGHINECVRIVRQNRQKSIDVHLIDEFKNDEKVKALLRSGETTGCFYVESPAMRGLLKKLRCDNYISLVAASSIIRPGVARSGMMREYIQRFHNPNGFEYLHPVMEQQLKETYGVMVYQEDVIKVCHHFAGLDLADADVLRRAMSGKYRSKKEMLRITGRFFDNCRQKGYTDELTNEVWRQIESFAGYSFSKAHSASYAVESYQSLYLKSHYPLEFMTAVINNFGGFYQNPVYFNEAKRYGANIHLPCVNNSNYTSTIKGKDIYIGLVHIKNMEYKLTKTICQHREIRGHFSGLEDFMNATGAHLEQVLLLIRVNAFRFTGQPKSVLMWKAYTLFNKKPQANAMLFIIESKDFRFPTPEVDPIQEAYDELEILGFTVSVSPFDMIKSNFRGEVLGDQMINHVHKKARMVGWLVTTKYVRTVKKEPMHFGCFIDVGGNFFDTVHFPDASKNYPFRGSGVYLLLGTITDEFGHPSLTVEKMAKLPMKPDLRAP